MVSPHPPLPMLPGEPNISWMRSASPGRMTLLNRKYRPPSRSAPITTEMIMIIVDRNVNLLFAEHIATSLWWVSFFTHSILQICVATQKLIEAKSESQPIWLGVVFPLLWGVGSKEWGVLLWKWGACSEFWGVELKKRHGREEKSRFSIWSCAFYSFPAGHFFAADKKGANRKNAVFYNSKI